MQQMMQPQMQGHFSTLNNDVVPDQDFIEQIEAYQPKVTKL